MSKLILLLILSSQILMASVKDSLLSVINRGSIKEQATVCIKLEQQYRNNQPDSALYYITKAYQICKNNQLDTLLESTYSGLAISYKLQGKYDTTLYFFKKSLKLAVQLKDSIGLSSSYNNLGVFYDDIGERAKALDYFIKSLEISQKRNDKAEIALSFNNIGLIHYKNKNYKQAEKYYRMSLSIKEELGDVNGSALLYNNLGILFYFEDKPQECINYFKKAAKIWKETGNVRQTAMVLSNIGELYYEIGIYQTAMNYFLESLQIYKKLGDVNNELYELNMLGQVYHEWGNDKKAISYYQQAYKKALQVKARDVVVDICQNLSKIYQSQNKYQLSNKYLSLYTEYKDSILSIEKDKTMQELNTKYETQKKEQEIEILSNKDKLSQAEINKQKILNTSLIIGVFLILIVIVLFIRQNRIRKRSNDLLRKKNKEILLQKEQISTTNRELNQQNEEILAQRDEIEAQRDMVNIQKEEIELIHEHVSKSIDYAERIQNATLPSKEILNQHFSDSFVFFKPRDIVSGDFYWWAHVENQTIVTAVDSTGHGVPGAFMSMLGMSFLKEIIIKEYITHPGVILRKLRKEIITTLKQKGEIGEQKDGMDMALISFNHTSNVLQYAGANNPLYIISDNEIKGFSSTEGLIHNDNKKLYEIKPNKMPIAIYDKMDKFTTHEIQLNKGDQLYMFSDGFADQFGGPKGKKFKYKAFKNLLLENANLSMNKQQEILNNTLRNWMLNGKSVEEQVDDLVVIGLKI